MTKYDTKGTSIAIILALPETSLKSSIMASGEYLVIGLTGKPIYILVLERLKAPKRHERHKARQSIRKIETSLKSSIMASKRHMRN